MEPNLVRATCRELRSQPVVTALFVLAVIAVIVRTALLSVPEIFPGAARTGSVIYDLAIAYAGAWFFNVLVLVLPRLRDRERVLEGAGPVIQRLGALGAHMIGELGLRTDEFEDLDDSGQVNLFSIRLQDLSLTEESSLMIVGGDGVRPASWQEWAVRKAITARAMHESLVPYFPYFDSELIQLVDKVALSTFVEQGHELAAVNVSGVTMNAVARPLAQFIAACRKLRVFYATHVIMQDIPRDDNIVGEIAPF
jgi:hypothetical protein